ncbi:ABC transporter ATP-binding protein [Fodinicola acaciae]|uniref:ABC transporter ATP-binding protein n=1 Tax=Fodinicola acaciae TaxID=2681555 RepID=UPI0013D6C093|nr:ABC transporter ATP-binding protein [Fodinicola acaciae]
MTVSVDNEEILKVSGLVKHLPIRSGVLRRQTGAVRAVDGVDFTVRRGETLGLVGESGCGKTTTGRLVVRLLKPTAGKVEFLGTDLAGLTEAALRPWRSKVQIMFQDPYSSLSPRMTVHDIVAEPLRIQRRYHRDRVGELLELVGLSPDHTNRYAHEFSGGQRQRIGLARALALDPELLVLDEPVSALDVSIQAQVVNQLAELQDRLRLGFLFISHDLSVIRHISHRVAVMYLGRIVEIGTRAEVFEQATHPYTQALLSAVPVSHPDQRGSRERLVLAGDVPSPANPPSGCRFRTRCPKAAAICAEQEPELTDRLGVGHPSACHFPELAP